MASAETGSIVTDISSDWDCGFGRQGLKGGDKEIREAVQFSEPIDNDVEISWKIMGPKLDGFVKSQAAILR